MNEDKKHRICPVEHANALDFTFRRWIHNPKKILKSYVKKGMSALDLGCGPGFFTMEMARLVGIAGKVTAADLQEGMLDMVRKKIKDTDMAIVVSLHQCRPDAIGLAETFDFILVFYMLHEVPDQAKFLGEIYSLLKPDGRALLAEPTFHVGRDDFQKSIAIMRQAGLEVETGPKILFSRTVILRNASREDLGKQAQK
jgi:ubiquinone/menaquinone biosynthesis C-methylase UbiE